MTELKCPFCGQELNTENYYIHCHNPHCNKTVDMDGNEELWQALIDTKKNLDIAVDALFDIHKHSYACCNPVSEIGYIHAVCYNALEKTYEELKQIKQKEEK